MIVSFRVVSTTDFFCLSIKIVLMDTVEPKRDIEQFCQLMSGIVSDGNEAEFRELFDIIDTDKEGFVDWDKFCSHMQRDYQEKDDRLKTTQVCCAVEFGLVWTSSL